MNNFDSKNVFLANILIILALFVLVFFTKNYYTDFHVATDNKIENEKLLEEKNNELTKLQNVKMNLTEEDKENYKRYDSSYSDAEVLYFIHDLARNENKWISIEAIKSEEWIENKYGFKEGNINVSVSYETEEDLLKFVSGLTNSEEYVIFIDKLSYAMTHSSLNNNTTTKKTNLPLVIYYK